MLNTPQGIRCSSQSVRIPSSEAKWSDRHVLARRGQPRAECRHTCLPATSSETCMAQEKQHRGDGNLVGQKLRGGQAEPLRFAAR
eukprot:2935097-Pleurochrysis_carterae.AAC.4